MNEPTRGRGRPPKQKEQEIPAPIATEKNKKLSSLLPTNGVSSAVFKDILSVYDQSEVAAMLKVSQSTVSMWSRSKKPVAAHLQKEVAALHAKAKEMML